MGLVAGGRRGARVAGGAIPLSIAARRLNASRRSAAGLGCRRPLKSGTGPAPPPLEAALVAARALAALRGVGWGVGLRRIGARAAAGGWVCRAREGQGDRGTEGEGASWEGRGGVMDGRRREGGDAAARRSMRSRRSRRSMRSRRSGSAHARARACVRVRVHTRALVCVCARVCVGVGVGVCVCERVLSERSKVGRCPQAHRSTSGHKFDQ